MGIIELISQFDPFLQEHLKRCQSQQSRAITYLSKTIYEEIIEIMEAQVLKTIVNQINEDVKYFALIVDSTPDLAHIDQLAIIFRYCYQGKPFERFLAFLPIKNHTAEYLYSTVTSFLTESGLLLENIRGQSSSDCRMGAKNLFYKLTKLEYAMLSIIWEEILERFNKVSIKLQTPGFDLQGYNLLCSLSLYIQEMRTNCEQKTYELEEKAKKLSEDIETEYADSKKRRTKLLSSGETQTTLFTGKDKFRIEIFNKLLDTLVSKLERRSMAYQHIIIKFKFLFDLGNISKENVDKESIKLVLNYYNKDLEEELTSEIIQFKEYLKVMKVEQNISCSEMMSII